jgi:hypothetical protein
MRFDQLGFLKKKMESAAYDAWLDKIENIQDLLRSIASTAECFLGMLMDDMKAKDIPIQKVNQNDLFVLDDKGSLKQILRVGEPKEEDPWKQEYGYEYGRSIEIPKTKKEGQEWQISCIEELLRSNKRLREYTPSNPELAKLTIQEIVYKLSIEMQIQNNVLMTALRHLMGKTEKTKIEESELL